MDGPAIRQFAISYRHHVLLLTLQALIERSSAHGLGLYAGSRLGAMANSDVSLALALLPGACSSRVPDGGEGRDAHEKPNHQPDLGGLDDHGLGFGGRMAGPRNGCAEANGSHQRPPCLGARRHSSEGEWLLPAVETLRS